MKLIGMLSISLLAGQQPILNFLLNCNRQTLKTARNTCILRLKERIHFKAQTYNYLQYSQPKNLHHLASQPIILQSQSSSTPATTRLMQSNRAIPHIASRLWHNILLEFLQFFVVPQSLRIFHHYLPQTACTVSLPVSGCLCVFTCLFHQSGYPLETKVLPLQEFKLPYTYLIVHFPVLDLNDTYPIAATLPLREPDLDRRTSY